MIYLDHAIPVPIFYLPKELSEFSYVTKSIETSLGPFTLQYPKLTGEDIKAIAAYLKKAGGYLKQLRVDQIIERIDRAIQKWLDPDYHGRIIAEALLPAITGYDAEMIRIELKSYMRGFRKKELLRFLEEEFDQPAMLDEFRPRKTGGMSRVIGPEIVFHVFSGNVPGVPVWSLIMGLLVKSASLGKSSFSEPLLPALFCQSLAEVDPKLGEALAVIPWQGGTKELEDPAIHAADPVIAYGSNQTVEAIRLRVPYHKRLLSFGHKISFAMVGREALRIDNYLDTLYRLTEDIATYDQQSCMAPQSLFIEAGGAIEPKMFAELLANELIRYNTKRPRSVLGDSEAMAIQKVRTAYRFQTMEKDSIALYASPDNTAATVIFHDGPGFEGSPLNRTVHVFSVTSLDEAIECVKPYHDLLQSCGIAVRPQRLFSIAHQLGECGVDRVTSIGHMNRAQAGWHHDGRFNLLDMVRFVDIERNVEQALDYYDPDMEDWR